MSGPRERRAVREEDRVQGKRFEPVQGNGKPTQTPRERTGVEAP